MLGRDAGHFAGAINLGHAACSNPMSDRGFNDAKLQGGSSSDEFPPKSLLENSHVSIKQLQKGRTANEKIRTRWILNPDIKQHLIDRSKRTRHQLANPAVRARIAPTHYNIGTLTQGCQFGEVAGIALSVSVDERDPFRIRRLHSVDDGFRIPLANWIGDQLEWYLLGERSKHRHSVIGRTVFTNDKTNRNLCLYRDRVIEFP